MKQATQQSLALIACLLTCTAITSASPVGGSVSASGTLNAGSRKPYQIHLVGGESWQLTATGYGDGDLDCHVYDEDGILVGRDADDTQTCIITGVPEWTGRFTVILVNAGDDTIGYNVRVR